MTIQELPLIYQNVHGECINGAGKWIWLYGGRGIGKTTLLHQIARDLPAHRWVKGTDRVDVLRAITTVLDDRNVRAILVDDLDEVMALKKNKERTPAVETEIVKLVQRLCKMNDERKPNQFNPTIVVTGSLTVKDASHEIMKVDFKAGSDFQSLFVQEDMLAWDEAQNKAAKTAIRKWLTKPHQPLIDHAWIDLIELVTGWYPSLVGHALEYLRRNAELQTVPQGRAFRVLKDELEEYLAQAKQFREVNGTLEQLQQQSPEVMHVLRAMANSSEAQEDLKLEHRLLLRPSGLVHRNKEENWVVSGSVLTSMLRSATNPTPPSLNHDEPQKPNAPPAPGLPHALEFQEWREEGGGTVVGVDAHGDHLFALDLIGAQWHFFISVASGRGQPVSLTAIAGPGEKTTRVRSTYQRLEQKLRKANLDALIENVHGQGYRLAHGVGLPPHLPAPDGTQRT